MTSATGASLTPLNRFWRTIWLTLVKYSTIDGQQRAASFAYYAFFALFPLLLLLVSIGSFFFGASKVGTAVLEYISHYVFVASDKHDLVTDIIHAVTRTRRGVGIFAVLGLLWSSFRFFQSLVIGVNRAWGTHEYSWWRLPLQNLIMVGVLAGAVLIGFLLPLLLRSFESLIATSLGASALLVAVKAARFALPSLVLFCGFSTFYKLAPARPTTFREVWFGALVVTVLLQAVQALFILYAIHVGKFNSVYGAFGSVIAVLMWVYLSGSIIILGGCYCAARAEVAASIRNGMTGPPLAAPRPDPAVK